METFKKFIKKIISFVYPNTCLNCGEIIPEGEFFCDCCFEQLEITPVDKMCLKCGNTKKNCFCKSRVYSFEKITAPFYKNGAAQKAMYAFKLGRRVYISEFFSQRMALKVKYDFYGTRFDGICYVPLSAASLRKRGFNQSKLLAEQISDILKIPLITDQLSCVKKSTSQHKTKGKERFQNIKGAYRSNKAICGRILLIDDIKTTGATLDECSKQLLSSGAESVWCVTGLITDKKRG